MNRSLARIAAMLLVLAALPVLAATRANLPDFTGLVRENSPAVVNISTKRTVQAGPDADSGLPELPEDHPFHDFFDRFRDGEEPPTFETDSLGSGFIIDADGYILTNHHVVKDATEIVVRLPDRREFDAEVVGADPRSDLALIAIDTSGLPTVTIGRSSKLQVGEWVLAIGSPFGFDHSVTAGIVSALGRNLPQENYVPFIQTDVAINPGNSGGPLFNLDGEVVGINSHIYSRTGGFMGVSFAIPIELAMDVARQLREEGHVARGWLGVMIQDVTRDLAESFGMRRPRGALVSQILEDSPAADSPLRVGDVIVRFDGHDVPTSGALPAIVGRTPVGEQVPVEIIREGERRTVQVRVGELPEDLTARGSVPAPEGRIDRLGLVVAPLDDGAREALGLAGDADGVMVERVTAGPAREAGVRRGDVITRLDRKAIDSPAALRDAVAALEPGRSVAVLVRREDGPRFLALRLPGQ
ncbi:DegQ family serine endoprotease [Arhodomonas aquaeolei]|uniref:DegQ family serine endoprotease n=1 Tax=Arhodomonas aquaeolei TaxID=2369 RepID=UPI0021676DC2|nr:DegQ family serine endoprotease [Arhodomonas aquaeolei]MCS4503615.1 DegQ family serine endoprotease [Arhodomonas aquaeolei]